LTTEYGWTALHWAAQGKKDSEGHWHPLRDVLQVSVKQGEALVTTTFHSHFPPAMIVLHPGAAEKDLRGKCEFCEPTRNPKP